MARHSQTPSWEQLLQGVRKWEYLVQGARKCTKRDIVLCKWAALHVMANFPASFPTRVQYPRLAQRKFHFAQDPKCSVYGEKPLDCVFPSSLWLVARKYFFNSRVK